MESSLLSELWSGKVNHIPSSDNYETILVTRIMIQSLLIAGEHLFLIHEYIFSMLSAT